MLVPFGDPCAIEHPRRPMCEATLAGSRHLASVLLHNTQPRTFTDDANFGHILSIQFLPALVLNINQFGAVFGVSLYIRGR
jgi:hypothetical protein